jgi:hypothetical protein
MLKKIKLSMGHNLLALPTKLTPFVSEQKVSVSVSVSAETEL